jgi:hypothetical protein
MKRESISDDRARGTPGSKERTRAPEANRPLSIKFLSFESASNLARTRMLSEPPAGGMKKEN